jgi:hypothetical protein
VRKFGSQWEEAWRRGKAEVVTLDGGSIAYVDIFAEGSDGYACLVG